MKSRVLAVFAMKEEDRFNQFLNRVVLFKQCLVFLSLQVQGNELVKLFGKQGNEGGFAHLSRTAQD